MNGTRTQEMMNNPDIIKRDKTAEKGRVRRIKVKVLNLLNKSRRTWKRFVGPEWVERLVILKALKKNESTSDSPDSSNFNSNSNDSDQKYAQSSSST